MNTDNPATQYKTITCFLPAGRAQGVLERLRKETGVPSAFAYHARGAGLATRRDKSRPEYVEREMITALVPAERADEIFRFIFLAAGINEPHAGMVLMTTTPYAKALCLSDEIPDEV